MNANVKNKIRVFAKNLCYSFISFILLCGVCLGLSFLFKSEELLSLAKTFFMFFLFLLGTTFGLALVYDALEKGEKEP